MCRQKLEGKKEGDGGHLDNTQACVCACGDAWYGGGGFHLCARTAGHRKDKTPVAAKDNSVQRNSICRWPRQHRGPLQCAPPAELCMVIHHVSVL